MRLIPETRVRSSVATHLLTSLNLPTSSLVPDSNRNPVTGLQLSLSGGSQIDGLEGINSGGSRVA